MNWNDPYTADAIDESENEFLTPPEVMNLLYIGRNTFYRLVKAGEIPAVKIGKQWRVRLDDLRACYASHN